MIFKIPKINPIHFVDDASKLHINSKSPRNFGINYFQITKPDDMLKVQFSHSPVTKQEIVLGYLYNAFALPLIPASLQFYDLPTLADFSTLISYIELQGDSEQDLKGDSEQWGESVTDKYGFGLKPNGVRLENGTFAGRASTPTAALRDGAGNVWFLDISESSQAVGDNYGAGIRLVRSTSGGESSLDDGTILQGDYTGNDGRVYDGVKIGTQIWLTENLVEVKGNDDNQFDRVEDDTNWQNATQPSYCAFNNVQENAIIDVETDDPGIDYFNKINVLEQTTTPVNYVAFTQQVAGLQITSIEFQLPTGLFELELKISMNENNFVELVSEPVKVQDEFTNDVEISYNGVRLTDPNLQAYRYDFLWFFDSAPYLNSPVLRLIGGVYEENLSLQVDEEVFSNQQNVPINLYSSPRTVERWTFGDALGLPNYVAEKLALIFSLPNFAIDRKPYVKEEGAVMEREESETSLAGWSIDLVKSNEIFSTSANIRAIGGSFDDSFDDSFEN